MQTFVPYTNHAETAAFLDNARLFKQLVEGKQILCALSDPEYGWQAHPAVQMWRGHGDALIGYLLVLAEEWRRRGQTRESGDPYSESITAWIAETYLNVPENAPLPDWWGGPIHESHRMRLFWKKPEWYGPKLYGENWRDMLLEEQPDYFWPVNKGGDNVELLPHQLKAIDNLDNGKILWGGVGTGKTLTALAYYVKRESPKHIYVITTAKKRDLLEWEREAAKLGIGTDASLHGKICVDSWNNIKKYVDVEDAFFVFDEQRLVGHGTWVKSFLKIAKKNRWILLSATPGDTWLDYAPVFIANGFYDNITQFKREHIVYAPYVRYPKIIRYLSVGTLQKYRNLVLVEMPYDKHTKRHISYIKTAYDSESFNKVYKDRWNVFTDEPISDVAELFRTMRKLVAVDPSRVDELRQLLVNHPKIIVFYNFNYELEILRQFRDVVAVAEWNGHRKEAIPKTDSWLYLVQYVAGAEGWNCVETDTIVFFSMTYSYKNFEQAQGRIDRLDSPFTDLYYYVLTSDSLFDQALRRNLKEKKLFNERAFAAEIGLI